MGEVDGPQLTTNAAGIALIKEFEGFRSKAYQDQGGIWTIGYGCTHRVPLDREITEPEGFQMLMDELATFELVLNGVLPPPHLSANQFSALICFVYNVGFGAKGEKDGLCSLKTGEPSALLKYLLSNEFGLAALEFPKWNHIGRTTSAGLLRRRQAEQALFLRES